jgi:hypothetical protein
MGVVSINVRWEAPLMDWICINNDGALQHGVGGYDGVLRDHFGFWIKGFVRNIGTKLLLLMLGYGGLYDGLCLISRSGFTNIELQLDSMPMVKAIEVANLNNSGGRSLVRIICSLIHEGWNVWIRHVYRETNRVADALALLGCQLVDVSLYDDPPNGIYKFLSFWELLLPVLFRCNFFEIILKNNTGSKI